MPRVAIPWIGKVYVCLVIIESVTLVAASLASFYFTDDQDHRQALYIGILCALAASGFLYFALDAILLENIFQFWASVAVHVLILCYVIWERILAMGKVRWDSVDLWILIGVSLFQLIYLVIAPQVQAKFGWRLYRRVGGNLAITGMYRTAHIFLSLLKLDLLVGLLLDLLASLFLLTNTLEIIVAGITLGVTVVWAALGYSASRQESPKLMVIFWVFAPLEPAYIAVKLYQLNTRPDQFPPVSHRQFWITGCLAIVIRGFLLLWSMWVWRNFGLGLRNRVFIRNTSTDAEESISDYDAPIYDNAYGPPTDFVDEDEARVAYKSPEKKTSALVSGAR